MNGVRREQIGWVPCWPVNVLITLLYDQGKVDKAGEYCAAEDEVEFLVPCPFLFEVIDFETAVGRTTGVGSVPDPRSPTWNDAHNSCLYEPQMCGYNLTPRSA